MSIAEPILGTASLLAKFDAVEVTKVSLISEHDERVCESESGKYRSLVEWAARYKEFLSDNPFEGKSERLADKMDDEVKSARESFITNVVYHFVKTYNVEIDSYTIRRKYEDTPDVTYQQVVEEIIVQLDGLNFSEKALHDLKEKMSHHVGGRHQAEVKGVKVSVPNLLYYQDSIIKGKFYLSNDETLRHLTTAISYFESGKAVCRYDLASLADSLRGYKHSEEIFREFDYQHCNKFKSIRFFKNGKVEMKFGDSELALAFAREFLKYTA